MDVERLLAQFSEQQVAGFMLVLGRLSPLFLLSPLFSSRMLPGRGRAVIAVALAVGLWPVASQGGPEIPLSAWAFGALMLKEMLVGMAFAFALAVLFAALSAAGAIVDTMIGFSFGALVDPVSGTQSSILANLYALVGLAVFVAIGGEAWVIQGMARTYEAVPLLEAPQIGTLAEGAQVAFSGVFAAALQVAAPLILALVITDAAFGVVSRVVPQMNIFSVGFPAKVTVGLVLIGASLPFVAGWLTDQLQVSVATALRALKVA